MLGRLYPSITPAFKSSAIPVHDVLTLLDAGYRPSDIKSMIPTLEDNDISACIGFAATHIKDRHEYKRNNRYKAARILLDENLSPALVEALYQTIGGLSSIYYEGMNGYTDEFIYWRPTAKISKGSRTKKNMRHVIITQDSDLCDIAEAQWMQRIHTCATPESINFMDTNTIILIADPKMAAKEGAEFYKKLAGKIMRAVFNPETPAPWYRASKTSLSAGISLQKLIEYAEKDALIKRYLNGEVSEEERAIARAKRKTSTPLTSVPSIVIEPQTAPLLAPV